VDYKLRRGVDGETPLLLLLRKYLRDARLLAVSLPIPYERVVEFAGEHAEHGPTRLVLELIGRQPNLLLLRPDGRILDCLHRHAPAAAAAPAATRVLLPGRAYSPPPPQPKLPPRDDGRPDYYEQLAALLNTDGKLAKALTAGIAGMSTQAAREVAFRAAGDPDAPAAAAHVLGLAAALQSLWADGGCTPGVLQAGEQIVGFAPYPAHGPGAFIPTPTLSEAAAAYFAGAPARQAADAATTPPAGADPYAAQRAAAAAQLRKARAAVARRLGGLAADEPPPGAGQELRSAAEWLLALSHEVRPGQTELAVPLDDSTLRIALDPALSPVEQAARMFRRAAKWERAAVAIPLRRAELEADLILLDDLDRDLQTATNQPEIAGVLRELAAAGLAPQAAQRPAAQGGRQGVRQAGGAAPAPQGTGGILRVRSPQGFEILAGRNARQNERVTFGEAHPNDLWLHARGVPGSHVVIRTAGRSPDPLTVELAAQLAAYHSGARGDRAVPVIVTRKRHVARAPGGKVGQVLVKVEEQVLTVPGDLPPLQV
jgi:predicted ribosome quality control (RQC) complex YloA/Tae2 family protein